MKLEDIPEPLRVAVLRTAYEDMRISRSYLKKFAGENIQEIVKLAPSPHECRLAKPYIEEMLQESAQAQLTARQEQTPHKRRGRKNRPGDWLGPLHDILGQ